MGGGGEGRLFVCVHAHTSLEKRVCRIMEGGVRQIYSLTNYPL